VLANQLSTPAASVVLVGTVQSAVRMLVGLYSHRKTSALHNGNIGMTTKNQLISLKW